MGAKDAIEAAEGLAKAVPVYQDAVQPAAKEVGKALETVGKSVNLALAPLRFAIWTAERAIDWATRRVTEILADTPPEEIVTPPPSIAGPTLAGLQLVGEDLDLREMYASLLAASMVRKSSSWAHPAFAEIIRQLSPDDAKVLRVLATDGNQPVVHMSMRPGGGVDARVPLTRNQSLLDEKAGVSNPGMTPGTLDNLCRLGLAEIPTDVAMQPGTYDALEAHPALESLRKKWVDLGAEVWFQRRFIRLTDFGKVFVWMCVVEPPPDLFD